MSYKIFSKTIFLIKNKLKNKIANILKINDIIIKTNDILIRQNLINKMNQRFFVASVVNKKAFENFRGIYREKDIALIAAGPTVNYFSPINDAIYVGCNRAFLFNKVNFDYLFAIDKKGIDNYYKEFFEYRKENCIKFVGDQNLGENYQIPENIIPINNKIFRYITNAGVNLEYDYPLDISISPLLNPPTVSLQAM